jgi:DNA helicase-2/ATP-dependent DNA helicase PcrA
MTDILAGLNPPQREAVTHPGGPLLVFAGAGSGKTRVLTHRVGWLIQQGKARPDQILAVTFTNRAAREMKERIEGLLGERSAAEVWAGTFHSTCAKLLRISGEKIGLDRNFVIFDDEDQIRLIKECLHELNIPERSYPARGVLSAISHAKEKLLDPDTYLRKHSGVYEETVAGVWRLYARKLREMRALDFDDLIVFAVRLLEERQDAREQYQRRFRHVLVDEYQDINYSQYRFVELLAQEHRNITVVGDDDQSIYSWRGADISIILNFERDFPDAHVVKLEQNYRSTQIILDAAHEVVSANERRAEKRLWTENGPGSPLTLWEAADEQHEADLVAQAIQEQIARGRRPSDFAVLYRTNAQSRPFEEVFMHRRIPYRIIGGVRFWERKEVKDIIAYLRLVANSADNISFKRIVNVPARGIGAASVARLEEAAAARGISIYEAARDRDTVADLQPKAARALREFVDLIEGLRASAAELPVSDLMKETLERTGYLRELENERTMEARGRIENLQELVSVAALFDTQAEDTSLEAFLAQVALVSDVDSLDDRADSVVLMTLHSAKGLEFPVVFMTGLEEGIFPHSRSLTEPRQLEEERRLCYVGMTRAKEELHFTYAFRRMAYGMSARSTLSRFVKEIPAEYFAEGQAPSAVTDGWAAAASRVRTVVTNDSDSPFREGDRVTHPKFGTGVVISATGRGDEAQVTVMFAGGVGLKKLLLAYAKLEKAGNGAAG